MTQQETFLETLARQLAPRAASLTLPWPQPGQPAGFRTFETLSEWRLCVEDLGLRQGIPEIVAAKYRRAQKLYLLAWVDIDLIKAGELVALTALELALNDCYGDKVPARGKPRKPSMMRKPPIKAFADLLDHMVVQDGLTDAQIPMIARYGGTVVDRLRLDREGGPPAARPTLSEIRNDLAHGYPFDGFPRSDILELVRDLIEYAYRDFGTAAV
ncbi:hypothetical protein QH494_00720 [Sphingomonas sp. AR_OL41]|jgi:hypothetical protein|uniref:hypothetical protein n=1 Tax=Facivitalis istanbulensis TaxID=3075838 RepID=UPI00247FE411|nr:hypothetical protein [Sphingomonas sp. AR_OL41]MDH7970695.1 hypothetical protein [Sphingomonas sp. AR_OL41]